MQQGLPYLIPPARSTSAPIVGAFFSQTRQITCAAYAGMFQLTSMAEGLGQETKICFEYYRLLMRTNAN